MAIVTLEVCTPDDVPGWTIAEKLRAVAAEAGCEIKILRIGMDSEGRVRTGEFDQGDT